MKEEIRNPKTSVEYITKKQWKLIASVVKNIKQIAFIKLCYLWQEKIDF